MISKSTSPKQITKSQCFSESVFQNQEGEKYRNLSSLLVVSVTILSKESRSSVLTLTCCTLPHCHQPRLFFPIPPPICRNLIVPKQLNCLCSSHSQHIQPWTQVRSQAEQTQIQTPPEEKRKITSSYYSAEEQKLLQF